ncbi:MAG: VCBS repeat-containing protein, partial [Verrucomicrobiae bacterium]|nr:VCBS repeat-containing protein [Verrucomicrobiae bacterium]
FLASFLQAGERVTDPALYDDDQPVQLSSLSRGEQTARRDCSLCPLYVAPSMLTRSNWYAQILPRMKVELGLARPDYSSSPDGELIRQRRIYPERPRVPPEDWPWIEEFYLQNSPEKPLPQPPRPEIKIGLPLFEVVPARFRVAPPSTTMVKISTNSHQIYVGDDNTRSLYILNSDGAPVARLPIDNVPTDVAERNNGIYVVCIGSFLPTEVYCAELIFLPRLENGFGPKQVILSGLPRATQIKFADFNRDGLEDFVLCMFGNRTGRFSWFENLGGGSYREHVLGNKSGAMVCEVHDFNGDLNPDIALLMSQELEQLIILLNDGNGNFHSEEVFREPPVFGHSNFQMVDFNRDGRLDILVCNGDNGEYDSPTKYYHAIRIWLAREATTYEKVWEFPLNGAYGAFARDYDGDGDLDIAAISYFPDWINSPRESFVYLENQGQFNFTASTFPECISGHWIVMDSGDLDADGDADIVLGCYAAGPGATPAFLQQIWRERAGSILILRNTLVERRKLR